MRGDTEVEQHPIEARARELRDGIDVGEVAEEGAEPTRGFVLAETLARRGDGLRVSVERGYHRALLEQGESVPATTECAVQHVARAVQE